jgi:hypothetical protein
MLALALALAFTTGVSAAILKSIQTNATSITALTDVSITAVNMSRTFVICQSDTGGANNNATVRATCELTSTTNLRITPGNTVSAETVRWYVVEFYSGVTVQRGVTSMGTSATANAAITAVDLSKTFVLATERANDSSAGQDERWTRNETGSLAEAPSIAWQVVQIESAFVQSGSTTIAGSQTAATATLTNAVDTSRTFVVFSARGGTNIDGVERFYRTTGVLTNATTLTFTRAFQDGDASRQVDIAWFAVRMTDGTTVQRGTSGPSGTGAGSATLNATLGTAIDTARSIPLVSVRGDAASGANTALDDTSWKARLTSSTNLELTRVAANSTNATLTWEVIQFAVSPNLVDRSEFIP